MLNRPSNGFIKRVVVLVGALLAISAVLSISTNSPNVAFAQEGGPIMYDENGTGPVRRFQSEDPEGKNVYWDVTGTDADNFEISAAGVLTFKKSPNYESPEDRAHALDLNDDGDTADMGETDLDRNNMYQITVRASEMRDPGETRLALSTEANITVEVMNQEELGKVELNWLHPEVTTPITASLSDPDTGEAAVQWVWTISKVTSPKIDTDGDWRASTGEVTSDGATYTPHEDDEGGFLRAVATYTDAQSGTTRRTVRGMSAYDGVMYAVRPNATANGSPGFSTSNPALVPGGFTLKDQGYAISVPEDMAGPVGSPVEATDPNNDVLTYQLDNDDDTANDLLLVVVPFSIDKKTGQVSAKGLNHEKAAVAGVTMQGQYLFYVRATDPSGRDADVKVVVTATEANDTPKISGATLSDVAPAELRVMEQDSDDVLDGEFNGVIHRPGDGDLDTPYERIPNNTFTATDEDERYVINWTLEGPDAAQFILDATVRITGDQRQLQFRQPPNYEMPGDANGDSVYKVTMVASDGKGGVHKRPVTVFVDNVEEHGKAVMQSEADDETQPEVGKKLTVMVEDEDEIVTEVTWQWSIGPSNATGAIFTPINGATTSSYTPSLANEGDYLRATVTYLDSTSVEDDLTTPDVDERVQVAGPVFKPVTNADPAGAASDMGGLYRVVVTSEHAVQASASRDDDMPTFAEPLYQRSVFENAEEGSIVGIPVTADYGSLVVYSLERDDTADNRYFEIDATGQIRVGTVEFPSTIPLDIVPVPTGATAPAKEDPSLNYEAAKNTYTLQVTATDPDIPDRVATTRVRVTLKDLNESPWFDKASRDAVATTKMYAENVGTEVYTLAARDPDGEPLRWEVTGTDAADFKIDDSATDAAGGWDRVYLQFDGQPNFEKPSDREHALDLNDDGDTLDMGEMDLSGNNIYNVTVRATEMTDAVGGGTAQYAELHVAVEVTNVNEPGKVTLNWLKPEVGTPITATLMDQDGDAMGNPTWRWYRSKVDNPEPNPDNFELGRDWELITPANMAEYTPAGIPDDPETTGVNERTLDVERFLLVRADYTDPSGPGRISYGMSAYAGVRYTVRADVPDENNNSPDFNADTLDLDETTRTVPEDTRVGDPIMGGPVVVDVNEDGDVLTYEILKSTDDDFSPAVEGVEETDQVDLVADGKFFNIDKASGVITLAKRVTYEGHPAGEEGKYSIIVRATDPSYETTGRENDDHIKVVITALERNDAPTISGGLTELEVREADINLNQDDDGGRYYIGLGNTADLGATPATVSQNASDENLYIWGDEDDPDSPSWMLEGPDARFFEFSTPRDNQFNRRIHFIDPPDYEDPQDRYRDNVYELTLAVYDNHTLGDRKSDKMNMRVEVLNVNEMGELTLTSPDSADPSQPERGNEVIAVLTDPDDILPDNPDGMVENITDWAWRKSRAKEVSFADATIMPPVTIDRIVGNVGDFLWASVDYRDGASVENDPITALDERNDNPETDAITEQHKFQIGGADPTDTLFHNSDEMLREGTDKAVQEPLDDTQDGPRVPKTTTVQRFVAESTPSTGYAGDPIKGLGNLDTISGPDGSLFVFAEYNDTPGTTNDADDDYYDDELRPEGDPIDKPGQLSVKPVLHLDHESNTTYTVEIMDPDAQGGSDVVRVILSVTDVNEAPSKPEEQLGVAITGRSGIRYAENETDAVETYGAQGPQGGSVTWTLEGIDASRFSFSGGVLSFRATPDFESPADTGGDNVYEVTVVANDEFDEAVRAVVITVTNEDEAGTVTLTPTAANVDGEIMASVTDIDSPRGIPDADVMWQWAKSDARAGEFTDIEDATEASYMPVEADQGMYLRATATYTDGEGSGKTESEVTTAPVAVTMDNDGRISFSPRQPAVGRVLTARLSDADNPMNVTWQWASSAAMDGAFTDSMGATDASYTPVAADEGMYLQATAMYNDDFSSNRTAKGVTANAVIVIVPSTDTCIEPLGMLVEPETVMGTWASDCMSTAMTGSYARYYSFTLNAPTQVEMNLTSSVDAYLALRQGEGRDGMMVASNDNVGSRNPNSAINMMLAAGDYTVEATTFFAGQTGDFTLSVRPLQETEDLGILAGSVDRSNSMWVSDYMSTQQAGSYARSYTFTVNTATHVAINLTSPEDSYLYVLDSNGAVVHENDNVTTPEPQLPDRPDLTARDVHHRGHDLPPSADGRLPPEHRCPSVIRTGILRRREAGRNASNPTPVANRN